MSDQADVVWVIHFLSEMYFWTVPELVLRDMSQHPQSYSLCPLTELMSLPFDQQERKYIDRKYVDWNLEETNPFYFTLAVG